MKKSQQIVTAYIIHILQVLTKPQKKQALIYLLGLIWLIKFRSIRQIAAAFGHKKTDSLQHFMRHSPQAQQQMQEASRECLSRRIDRRQRLLVIDDTADARQGKHIEGLGVHHSGNGLVKGLCAVTAVLKTGPQTFAWAIRAYYPKKCCPVAEFQSKVQLAAEIIKETRRLLQGPVTVLIDAWYTCAPILGLIIEAQWYFVAAIKQNRKILVNGHLTYVRQLAKGPRNYTTVRLSRNRPLRVARCLVVLPKVGTVVLLVCKQGKDVRFLISNHLDLSTKELVDLYRQRFAIEFFHKDIKQHLGFGETFVRSHTCVQTHWTLVVIAYNAIALLSSTQWHGFRRKIHRFRLTVTQNRLKHLTNQI